jgi:DNA-directed RNA polymerase subunit K/omega
LNEGARPLVESDSDSTVALALDEIAQEKIKVIPPAAAEETE